MARGGRHRPAAPAIAICADDGSYAWGVLAASLAVALLTIAIVVGWTKRLLRRLARRG